MRKVLCLLLIFAGSVKLFCGDFSPDKVFQNYWKNSLNSLTYNYGLNFVGAGLGTWAFIETKIDHDAAAFFRETPDIARGFGIPAVIIGYTMPVLFPAALWTAGHFSISPKLMTAGLALGQSIILSMMYVVPLKVITGRASPGIITAFEHKRYFDEHDASRDFRWGLARRGVTAGWPSGHTLTSVSMAAALSEIYSDNFWVKAAAWTYAAAIAAGVGVSVHWTSDILAGALIGWAVGKTVGRDFKKRYLRLTEQSAVSAQTDKPPTTKLSFFVEPNNTLGLRIEF